ncbi:MAG TPA: hypothetical protein VND93_33190 [Myxococcales bacterium]|nr:hypothetical protein [Myxococcales bacterium]
MTTTSWREIIADGEAARLEELARQLNAIQRRRASSGQAARGLHAKGLAGVHAELAVLPDLPDWARAGLFSTPATYRGYARFSNGSGLRQHDRKGDVRGLALKLLGVEGKKIIPGLEDARTQDFLLIQSASTPFKDAEEFIWFVRAAERPALLLPRVLARFGPRAGLRLIRRLVASASRPVPSMATAHYYSALAIKWGSTAVRYALAPHATSAPGAKTPDGRDALGEELAARLLQGPVVFDFRIQPFKDEATTPIEDASREWREEDSPFHTVARLTLPRQDLRSPSGARLAAYVESLSFDPWHAGEDFRPLGNMMRARNAAYRLSTQERGVAPEPDGPIMFD